MERLITINDAVAEIDWIFDYATILTGSIFAVVLALLIGFAIKYRERPGHKAHYTRGDSPAAVRMSIALALLVFFGVDISLAYFDHHAFLELYSDPPSQDEATVVDVFAKQFEWNFAQAGSDGEMGTDDDIFSINTLTVPTGKPVLVRMRSLDVLHSFFIPYTRGKQDVLPGMTTAFWFDPDKTTAQARAELGDPEFEYEIACAELCGLGHTTMRGTMTVLTPEEFAAWQAEESANAANFDMPEIWWDWSLDPADYAEEGE
jgi:cytochrome c oxidase subunit 2